MGGVKSRLGLAVIGCMPINGALFMRPCGRYNREIHVTLLLAAQPAGSLSIVPSELKDEDYKYTQNNKSVKNTPEHTALANASKKT